MILASAVFLSSRLRKFNSVPVTMLKDALAIRAATCEAPSHPRRLRSQVQLEFPCRVAGILFLKSSEPNIMKQEHRFLYGCAINIQTSLLMLLKEAIQSLHPSMANSTRVYSFANSIKATNIHPVVSTHEELLPSNRMQSSPQLIKFVFARPISISALTLNCDGLGILRGCFEAELTTSCTWASLMLLLVGLGSVLLSSTTILSLVHCHRKDQTRPHGKETVLEMLRRMCFSCLCATASFYNNRQHIRLTTGTTITIITASLGAPSTHFQLSFSSPSATVILFTHLQLMISEDGSVQSSHRHIGYCLQRSMQTGCPGRVWSPSRCCRRFEFNIYEHG